MSQSHEHSIDWFYRNNARCCYLRLLCIAAAATLSTKTFNPYFINQQNANIVRLFIIVAHLLLQIWTTLNTYSSSSRVLPTFLPTYTVFCICSFLLLMTNIVVNARSYLTGISRQSSLFDQQQQLSAKDDDCSQYNGTDVDCCRRIGCWCNNAGCSICSTGGRECVAKAYDRVHIV